MGASHEPSGKQTPADFSLWDVQERNSFQINRRLRSESGRTPQRRGCLGSSEILFRIFETISPFATPYARKTGQRSCERTTLFADGNPHPIGPAVPNRQHFETGPRIALTNDNHAPGFAEPGAASKKRDMPKHKHHFRSRWETMWYGLVGLILRYCLVFLAIFLLIAFLLWAIENLRF